MPSPTIPINTRRAIRSTWANSSRWATSKWNAPRKAARSPRCFIEWHQFNFYTAAMKKIYLTAITALVLLATPLARAWTYSDTDTLLIFRASGFNDVEFNIGNVSQFTNLSAGTTITVSGWDASLVTGTFGPDLTGVSVIIAATTSPYA